MFASRAKLLFCWSKPITFCHSRFRRRSCLANLLTYLFPTRQFLLLCTSCIKTEWTTVKTFMCIYTSHNRPPPLSYHLSKTPCEGIQDVDSPGFWIPCCGFRILFQWNLNGLQIPIVSGIPDSLSCTPDFKGQEPRFAKFSGFRIPQTKIPGIPESGFPYMAGPLVSWQIHLPSFSSRRWGRLLDSIVIISTLRWFNSIPLLTCTSQWWQPGLETKNSTRPYSRF